MKNRGVEGNEEEGKKEVQSREEGMEKRKEGWIRQQREKIGCTEDGEDWKQGKE